jgi:hypothetical protein
MLSDSLFEIRTKLLKEIRKYSNSPWESDYPREQEMNLILAIYHLKLAGMAYDYCKYPDHNDTVKIMEKSKKEFEKAIENSDSDSE